MAKLIGEAYIVVYPNTDGFTAKAEEGIERGLRGLNPEVKVSPDVDARAAAATKAKINALLAGAKLKLDAGQADAVLQSFYDRSRAVQEALENLRAHVDDTQAEATIAKLTVQAEALDKGLVKAGTDGAANFKPLEARLLAIEAAFEKVNAQKISLDDAQASAALQSMADRAGTLRIQLANFRATLNDSDMAAKVAALEAQATKLSRSLTFAPNDADLAPFEAGLLKVAAGFDKLTDAQKASDAELEKGNSLWAKFGLQGPGSLIHVTDILNASIPGVELFNGAIGKLYKTMSGNELPSFASHLVNVATSAHLTTEAAVEFIAIWGPALLGLSAFAVAAVPTVKDLALQIRNMAVVSQATAIQFDNLRIGQSKLAQAVKPQVMQLFGEYLLAAGQNGDHLAGVLTAIGRVLDNFGAKIDQALASQGTSKFLDKAAGDIQGLGVAFTQVGRIIGSLLQDVPGYAELLLKLGDAALTGLANVVQAVNPAIALFLKLHGAVLYIGLASTALIKFGTAAKEAGVAIVSLGAVEATGGKFQALGIAIGSMVGNLISLAKGAAAAVTGFIALAAEEGIVVAATEAMSAAISLVPFGIWGALALAAAAAIGVGLYAAMHQAASAATVLHTALEKSIADSNIVTIQSNIATAAQHTTSQLNEQAKSVDALIAANKKTGDAVINFHTGDVTAFGKALQSASSNIQENQKYLQGFASDNATAAVRINDLTNRYGSAINASKLMTLAGITQNDVIKANSSQWAEDEIRIQATAEAYGVMGQQAGAAGNQLDTLTISTGSVTKATQTLVSAEQQWLSIITGGDSAFTTFEQGLATLTDTITGKMTPATITSTTATQKSTKSTSQLSGASETARQSVDKLGGTSITTGQSLTKLAGGGTDATTSLSKTAKGGQDVATSLSKTTKSTTDYINALATGTSTTTKAATSADTLTVHIGNLKEVFSTAGAAMNGTSAASLAVRQAFDQQIQAAGTLYGNLQTLSAASGNTAQSGQELARAGKDIIAQLLPLAAGSKEATSEVYALAQIVGYTGPNDFAKLAQWVGRVKSAEGDLDDQQAKLTTSSATLSQAAKNLSGALQDAITTMQSQGLLATSNFNDAQKTLINTLQQSGGTLTSVADNAAVAYYQAMVKAGIGADQARSFTDALLQRLKVAPGTISAVNAQLDGMAASATQAGLNTDKLTTASNGLATAMAGLVSSGKLSTGQMDTLTSAIINNTGHVDDSHAAFDKLATQLGLTRGQADSLWTSLKQVTGTYSAQVNVKLSASGAVQAVENSGATANQKNAILGLLQFTGQAAGGIVTGHGASGRDSVPRMLAPGELVIPTSHAAAHAAQAKREGIPGMAAGGFIGASVGNVDSVITQAPGQVINDNDPYASDMVGQFAKDMIAAYKAMFAGVAGDVASYKPVVDTVLALLGQPLSDDAVVLKQMQTESGGNPAAVNNTDSNAAAGTPSTGLMQVIGPTFAAYAGPFANTGPFLNGVSVNPEANIYAALNYAIHRYGSDWTSVLGQGHGYSAGGMVNEPVFGIGRHTGTPYSFAENGPEYVGPISGSPASGDNSAYHLRQVVDELKQTRRLLGQMPYSQAKAINAANGAGVRRGYFATSG